MKNFLLVCQTTTRLEPIPFQSKSVDTIILDVFKKNITHYSFINLFDTYLELEGMYDFQINSIMTGKSTSLKQYKNYFKDLKLFDIINKINTAKNKEKVNNAFYRLFVLDESSEYQKINF